MLTVLYTNDPCPRWWAIDPENGKRMDIGFWSHPTEVTRGLVEGRAYLLSGILSPGEKPHYLEIGEHPDRMFFVFDVDLVRVCPADVLSEIASRKGTK